jgi:hypothetical protein
LASHPTGKDKSRVLETRVLRTILGTKRGEPRGIQREIHVEEPDNLSLNQI